MRFVLLARLQLDQPGLLKLLITVTAVTELICMQNLAVMISPISTIRLRAEKFGESLIYYISPLFLREYGIARYVLTKLDKVRIIRALRPSVLQIPIHYRILCDKAQQMKDNES